MTTAGVGLLHVLTACSSNQGRLAYVATGEGVFAFRINSHSGAPTEVLGSPFVAKTSATTATSPAGIAVHTSDRFLYVTNQSDNTIFKFTINSLSGALTEVLPRTAAGLGPGPMVLDASGSFLFVGNQVSNDVSVFSVGTNGALSAASTVSVGSAPSSLALPSSGNFLFVAVPNFSAIYVFSVSSGSLNPVNGSPFLLSSGVASVGVDPQGRFLYVPNPSQNTVSGFAIQSAGALSPIPGSPFSAGTAPVAAGVDPSGSFLYVANFGSTNLSQYTINSSNGAVTP
ncbi:MAG: beta-propeller fold lactonase family protein, partial [Acidobacteria bacterium]|nr:beta-propeller fold lactonase family protein [Acidobacteriota bacterium]